MKNAQKNWIYLALLYLKCLIFQEFPLLEAIELLKKEYGKKHYQPDLDPEGERLLSKYF